MAAMSANAKIQDITCSCRIQWGVATQAFSAEKKTYVHTGTVEIERHDWVLTAASVDFEGHTYISTAL